MTTRTGFPLVVACGIAIGLAALLGSSHAAAATLTGTPRIIDGDSFHLGDAEVRLFGVDALEGRQTCERNGAKWSCGAEAAAKLRSLVGSRTIACEQKDTDSYGRAVAVCRSGNLDLGAEMVRSGLAFAYRQYSNDYVDEENEARAARRGAWAGEFKPPSSERRDERSRSRSGGPNGGGARPAQASDREAVEPASSRCRGDGIKGNVSSSGERIYHLPGAESYEATRINESRGERWFCTEDEARRAGWRASRSR
jgi:endonuclease YncB( thermonuclease family)